MKCQKLSNLELNKQLFVDFIHRHNLLFVRPLIALSHFLFDRPERSFKADGAMIDSDFRMLKTASSSSVKDTGLPPGFILGKNILNILQPL